jgi:dihydrofolate reductase (trimethoprim resistance protein)
MLTKIHHEFEGDTFFPEVNYGNWNEVSVEKGIMNHRNPYNYYFHVYERKFSLG